MERKFIAIIVILGVILTGTIVWIYLENFIWKQATGDLSEDLDRVEFTIAGEDVDDFAYWLQDIDIDDIEDSKYDLIIMDYSSDGNVTGEYTSSEVNDMKSSGSREKFLLSYLSIGEAETYRFYWNNSWNDEGAGDPDAPVWLDEENPEWEGNYKVKFWMEGWQNITYEYIDHIIAAGFDGIYMDIIDAYEYYEGTKQHPDWLMIDFVGNISEYVKTQVGPSFIVFVQNGDELLQNSTYLNHIDGIGREDLFYDDDDDMDDDWRDESIDNLDLALEADKAVFIIDYPKDSDNIWDFYVESIDNDYLPYGPADRDLDDIEEYVFYEAT